MARYLLLQEIFSERAIFTSSFDIHEKALGMQTISAHECYWHWYQSASLSLKPYYGDAVSNICRLVLSRAEWSKQTGLISNYLFTLKRRKIRTSSEVAFLLVRCRFLASCFCVFNEKCVRKNLKLRNNDGMNVGNWGQLRGKGEKLKTSEWSWWL